MIKTAVIIGVGGADGAYLARLLLARGYRIIGTSRDAVDSALPLLAELGVAVDGTTRKLDPNDAASVAALLTGSAATELYHLGGDPGPVPALLAAVRALPQPPRLFTMVTRAVFGGGAPADETMPLAPITAAGSAEAAACRAVAAARTAGLYAVTGIVFDHASRLDPVDSDAARIVTAAQAATRGEVAPLVVAKPEEERDWGWSPEYVDAMWRMLQQPVPEDFVLATGTGMTAVEFAAHACDYFGSSAWLRLIPASPALPAQIGNPQRAASQLGWRAVTHGRDLVRTLCEGYTSTGAR